ncbi:MAG: hypothetical protein HY693_00175 [Deltaproteobacteria bacterium]|nr:hypothetical protein [Deltaproteobacteria bacterium]
MSLRDLKWSTREKKIARAAYEKAYKAEMQQIHEAVYKKVKDFRDENDVWRLHDYLTRKRREVDEKYDYRYSVLIFVLGRVLREGLISDEDVEGLSHDKVAIIRRFLEI